LSLQRYALLLDFGASRIKSILLDLSTGEFSHPQSQPTSPNLVQAQLSEKAQKYEVSLDTIKSTFLGLCKTYIQDLNFSVEKILICSEMHGFIVTDENNKPLTPYISWKDQRSLEGSGDTSTFAQISKDCSGFYKSITGMRLRPSLPFSNFYHLAQNADLPKPCKIISLPEWLSICVDAHRNIAHETMAAGLGFYDLNTHRPSTQLQEYILERTGKRVAFNEVTEAVVPSATMKYRQKQIPVYLGVGDHPCAVLGAGNLPSKTISVNIGTGSQVSIIDYPNKVEILEYRPYFEGRRLATITHIPAGRALNVCMVFLEDIAKACGVNNLSFWDILTTLSMEDILNSTLKMNLSFFPGGWNYSSGGSIQEIQEGSLSLKNYLASLIRTLAYQYCDLIEKIDPDHVLKQIIVSGGIPQKIPVISGVIANVTGREVKQGHATADETLEGLKNLSTMTQENQKLQAKWET